MENKTSIEPTTNSIYKSIEKHNKYKHFATNENKEMYESFYSLLMPPQITSIRPCTTTSMATYTLA